MKEKKYSKKIHQAKERRDMMFSSLDDYSSDLEHIASMKAPESTREWAEMRMYELRLRANKYEVLMKEYLKSKNVKFISQAPFCILGKLYFADFYLPNSKYIIEIDGEYHNGLTQRTYDRTRDDAFGWIGLRVLRLRNSDLLDRRVVDCKMEKYKVIRGGR